ncbi:aldehyde dehydrogenase (NADP(+)) [Actinomycetospora termitidis]|uniref:Aldehyde dehydrogenase (NADP(+)) n=1 Tax=Actinomycetospora termitidis TaxID=3053470 RepID=A0ABT7M8W7_9PSEU|nr:aldehyde dehydrogenase (NADP(+)) [Actinomycetospora sp. Odt1-22]MDL5156227.1 aldehyde dehydrogenase (NADP(+)) [Actinomycetospora sp. Odt1-22]
MTALGIRPEEALAAVDTAAPVLARTAPVIRASWLRAIADALDTARDDLVELAAAETHLTAQRLQGELRRTSFQARLLAERLATGALHDVRIDHADPAWPMGARPDIRRTQLPIGPVLVFGAGNFPFAFGVLGGDTVSALAAGCPVLVKAHPGHPRLCRRLAELTARVLVAVDAPAGAFGLIEDIDAGARAVQDRRVKAVAFTGSTRGGRALFDLAAARPDPVPFYGELGSTNPVIVSPEGWRTRASTIAEGFAASVTLGAGQFCTKPGVVLVPYADDFLAHLPPLPTAPMLEARIVAQYVDATTEMAGRARLAAGELPGRQPTPVLFRATVADLRRDPDLLDLEMFGPAALIVDYDELDELRAVVDALPGQLTGTVQGGDEPTETETDLLRRLAGRVGRVLWNDWPTGVTVSDAQHHGGPYPATTAPLSTSVGTASVARFLRPVAFQNVPTTALPTELRDPSTENGPAEGNPA